MYSGPLVLTVDDDVEINLGLQIRLRSQGYRCVEARDGQEGLDAANFYLPDVILTDIRMPVLDGISMLRELRKHERTSSIPTIMVTANISDKARTEALQYGAYCMIEKPYSSSKLLFAVKSALGEQNKFTERNKAMSIEACVQ